MDSKALEKLKQWFLCQKRDLPWREQPSPYAIWVSEVMLQQTQVSVVIPYFERWMKRFPTIRDLALAPLDEVIKEWEGLGYYSRARNLHEGALYVLKHHGGELPATEEALRKIKGLGAYTTGAILSFAFHKRAAAVDGNVLRVVARYKNISEDIKSAKTVKKIRQIVDDFLPKKEPWIISEALIELGAMVCSRQPKCMECPLKETCAAYARGNAHRLPYKSGKTLAKQLYRAVAVVVHEGRLLVRRGAKGKIMSDLYEFPYFEISDANVEGMFLAEKLQSEWQMDVEWRAALSEVKHSFTRYRAHLLPHLFFVKQGRDVDSFQWLSLDALRKLAFSAGHRRIFIELQNSFAFD